MIETENFTKLKENKMLRDYQQQASDAAYNYFTDKKAKYNAVEVLPTGCHAKGSKILMYDGTFPKINI